VSNFSQNIRNEVAKLRELVKLETDLVAPPAEVIANLRKTADRLSYMGKASSENIMSTVEAVLGELDFIVQQVGGVDTEWGRRIMDIVRKLDGFEVATKLQLRSVVDGFTQPTSLQFVSSLPDFPEKQVEKVMTGLYDLADEMEGKPDA
jgi:hypothetical protein